MRHVLCAVVCCVLVLVLRAQTCTVQDGLLRLLARHVTFVQHNYLLSHGRAMMRVGWENESDKGNQTNIVSESVCTFMRGK